MGLVAVSKELENITSEAEHLQKENAFRWAKPPLARSVRKGSACPLVPWLPGCGEGEVAWGSLGNPQIQVQGALPSLGHQKRGLLKSP